MSYFGTNGFALAFDTALSLQEMLLKLNLKLPQWEWIEWQNDRWGDYIRGNAKTKGDPWFKILYDDEIQRWAIDVSFRSTIETIDSISEQLRGFAISQLLPVIDAKRIATLEEDYSS